MAKKKARKDIPSAKGAKARKAGTAKARNLNGQPAPAGLDLSSVADLVQQMDRREQVMAWRLEHIEQQLAHLQQILVSLNQIYENRRLNEWRYAEEARHMDLLRQLGQKAAGAAAGR
jgi:ubiquinone biosynthesis protein Coq4